MMFLFASCHSAYEVTKAEGRMLPIDSTYDVAPDAEAMALLAPYKAKIDSMMYRVVGTAEMSMDKGAPESLLSNLVADVLRGAAAQVLGKPADMGLVNMGGLRNVLTEGPITCGNIYEILAFENSLCVVTLKGVYLKQLFESIAARGGEGVSGVKLRITKSGKLLGATVAGKNWASPPSAFPACSTRLPLGPPIPPVCLRIRPVIFPLITMGRWAMRPSPLMALRSGRFPPLWVLPLYSRCAAGQWNWPCRRATPRMCC